MSTTLSIDEAQARLPDLVARAAMEAEPCYIEQDGKAVAVLVSLRDWEQRSGAASAGTDPAAEEQRRRLDAYQERLQQLGPDFWLTAEQQGRLKILSEKEDLGEPLTHAERRELSRLVKRHEKLLVKRALAMQTRE